MIQMYSKSLTRGRKGYMRILWRLMLLLVLFFFFSSRRRHTRCGRDWSSDVCSSDLQLVAALARQAPQSTALGTQHQHYRAGQVTLVYRCFSLPSSSLGPDPFFTQLIECASQICNRNKRQNLCGATGDFASDSIEPSGFVFGGDNGVHAGRCCRAQTGTKVVRISHAVEGQ